MINRWLSKLRTGIDKFFIFFAEPEDSEFRPPEAELDEFHPKGTRTLFVGNLEKDILPQDLKDIFKEYGEIIVSISVFLPPSF